jgi:putative ABC transport system ATP-binding protein
MASVKIKDLIRVYKTGKSEVIALRGLDLNVNDGELVAIMGPSGCGKTTLLNLIGGLDRPTAGSIMIGDVDIVNMSDADLVNYRREDVGFVFQFFNLVPTLTAYENIELPMRLAGKPGNERKERVKEILDLIDLKDRASHKPDELSGGEQQRVALGTALVNDPKLILADEPTGELDTKTGKEVLMLFKMLRDKYNKTEIIVTHDRRISEFADRSLTIIDGLITSEESEREKERKALHEEFQKELEEKEEIKKEVG